MFKIKAIKRRNAIIAVNIQSLDLLKQGNIRQVVMISVSCYGSFDWNTKNFSISVGTYNYEWNDIMVHNMQDKKMAANKYRYHFFHFKGIPIQSYKQYIHTFQQIFTELK